MGKRHKKGITIYLDEHLPSEIKIPFQEMKLRTLEISKTKKYAGRNEFDYIHELFSENAVFATSDLEFVEGILDQNTKHAGIVYIPKDMARDDKITFVWAAAGFIRGLTDNSSVLVHNQIIYPAVDGVHIFEKGKDKLDMSWDWLNKEAEKYVRNQQRYF
jgi:hypothetical protein